MKAKSARHLQENDVIQIQTFHRYDPPFIEAQVLYVTTNEAGNIVIIAVDIHNQYRTHELTVMPTKVFQLAKAIH